MPEINQKELFNRGFCIADFADTELLEELQHAMGKHFPKKETFSSDQDERIAQLQIATDDVAKGQYVTKLLHANRETFYSLLGPDLDVQASPHVRYSRPQVEADLIVWHRDYFYGNTPWELNVWFPLWPLEENSGLALIDGSHRMPAKSIEIAQETNTFRKAVTKGSVANKLGYQYQPKLDDVIRTFNEKNALIIRPNVGQFILFFGHAVHKAVVGKQLARLTIDVRIKNHFTPTNTKPGYYVPFSRGIIDKCATEFLAESDSIE